MEIGVRERKLENSLSILKKQKRIQRRAALLILGQDCPQIHSASAKGRRRPHVRVFMTIMTETIDRALTLSQRLY